MNEDKVLTADEVANMLRVSTCLIRLRARNNTLGIPAIRVGKAYRFKESDVKKFLYGEQNAEKQEKSETVSE